MTVLGWCLANWKTLSIGALVLLLLGLGYYGRGVIADRDEAKTEIKSLKSAVAVEQDKAKQLQKASELKDLDIKKYQDALREIQNGNDLLDKKYTSLWNRYLASSKEIKVITVEVESTTKPIMNNVSGSTRSCYLKSISQEIQLVPAGVASFSNFSSNFIKKWGIK